MAGPDFFAPVATAPATAPITAAPLPATGAFTGPNDPLLAPGTLLAGPSGAAQGRNWTAKNATRVLPGTLRTIERRPGTPPKVVATGPAPWPDTAYVVTADGEDGRVRTADGRVLDAEAVADALAADPELAKLPKDVPVVLAVPYTGDRYLETLRVVADRLGRTVWGPSGVGRIVPDGTGDAHVLVTMDSDPDAPVGAWVSVAPSPTAGPYEDRTWTALDGTVFRDGDVVTRPLADENHQRFGRIAVHRQDGLRRRERNFRALRRMRRLVHWTPAGTRAQETASEPVVMDGAVYVFAGHGDPGRIELPLHDGRTVWLGKHDAAEYIAGLREVRELPRGHRMHLEVCWSSSDGDPARPQPSFAPVPHVDDPLGDVPLDQLVANLTRFDTDGSTRMTGMDDTRRFIMDAADGQRGRRVLRRPEPLDDELDRLAGVAGLHRTTGDVPAETREATLRLVRALRRVFGDAVEDDRATPGGRYERALRGIGALERLRANDPALNTFTPFRGDLLDFFVREHTGRAPDLAGYRALLDHAAARVAADPDARLTDAVPSPALQITLRQLADADEQMIRHVQSLPPQAAFTPRHVASTLWATARAAQLFRPMTPAAREAMGRKVLHLDPAVTWGRNQQQAVWAVSAKAIAQGMDATDHDLLAAFHLAESGAFGPASLLRQGPNIQGVNWSGAPAPAGIDWGALHRADGTASRRLTPEWTGPDKLMPLLNVIEVDASGTPVLHLPGRAPVRVPENEFLALLDLAPALRTVSLGSPVLFLTTGPGALSPELVQRFSQRTGRPAYGYNAPMVLAAPGPGAPLDIIVLPDPATNAPGHWTAATRQFTAPTASGQDQPAFFGPPAPADLGTDPFQDPATVLRDDSGRVLGRDLTGAWTDRVRTDRVREVTDGQAAQEPDEPAPWGSEAYLVGDRALDAQGLTPEAFAEKLAADPELAALPPHVPVVLAIPYAGAQYLELVRAVAGRLGRRVWAPSGDGRLRHDSALQARIPTMTVHDPAGWHGDWVPFDPPAVSAPFVDRQWTSIEGRTFRDSDVATLPLVFDRRVRYGRVSVADDLDQRERMLRGLFRRRQRIHYAATGQGDQLVSTEPYTPDPAIYTYYGHGGPGVLVLVLRDGSTVTLTAPDGGRYIGGLREVRELPPGYRIGLQVCYAASAGNHRDPQQEGRPVPPVEDPLEEVSLSRHTANTARREVEGPTLVAALDDDSYILEDTPGGVVGRVVRDRPEPTDAELDRLAVIADLHGDPDTVPPEVRATVLRLVRALRLVFDDAVEDDRWVPGGRYERALKGIAALETLRANDPGMRRFTPFRMELWTFLARRVGGDTPGRDAYRDVLDAARQLIVVQPDTTLSGMLPDTPLTYAVDELSGSQGVDLVRDAVGLPEPVTLRPKDITRAFWAMVAGVDLVLFRLDPAQQESLGRRALHLGDTEVWSDATTADLTFLAVRAHARRIDITDPHQLAAHHLRELGALRQTLTDGTEPTGYNWSGRPAPNGVERDRWYARVKAGNDVLTVPHPAQWRSTEPGGDSLVIWTGTRPDDGGIVIHLPGHAPLPVPDEELWALLDLAPLVTDAGVDVPVVFPMAGFTNGNVRRTQPFTDRTGRSAFGYSGPLDLIEDDPFAPLRITALREKKLGQWTRTVWKPRPVQGAATGTPGEAVKAGPSAWPEHSARRDSGTGTFHFTAGTPRRAQEPDGESGRPDTAYPSAVRINATPVSAVGQDSTPEPDPAEAAPAAAAGPAWALRSWRPAGSPGTARFAALYRDREWQRRSTAFELAFAAHTGRTAGLTEAARDAVSRMARELTARHGEQAALRAFFAPDAPPGDPAAALDRLLSAPPGPLTLASLMTAFTYAAHAGHGLPRETAETLARPPGRQGRYTPGSSYREVHDSRGMRRVGGEDGPALRLLRTYAALGAAPDSLVALRDALISWAIPADLQSLHEILRASHRAGGGTAAERDTALRDGAGLHTWAADSLITSTPDGESGTDRPAARLVPPHLALYAERMTFGRDTTRSGLNLPGDLAHLVDAALAGTLRPDTARDRVLLGWLDRYGDAGRDALRRLSPAHLTAIHLYSGADYRLMKAFLNGERFGAGMGRRLVRLNAWTMTSKMAEVGAAGLLPMTLRRQRGFTALFDAMWDVDDLQEQTAEVAALRRRLDAMADAVFAELPWHVDMVVEALEILPPLHGDVWWGDRGMPGLLGTPPPDGPVYGQNRITVPFFRSTALVRDEALGFMHRSKGAPGGTHLGLVHVADSTAREVSPFVVLPLETEVLYPPGASFDITTRTVVPGDSSTRPYESVEVTEATTRGTTPGTAGTQPGRTGELFGIAPPAGIGEAPSHRAPVLRTVRRQDGSTVGIASFDDADWAQRQDEYGRLAAATGFVSWERDGDGRPVPTHRALPGSGTTGGTFFFASHGGGDGLALVTEDGGRRTDDGSYAGRLVRSAGTRGFGSVTVLACGPGDVPRNRAEARARAQRIADGAALPVHLPTGRVAVSDGLPHLLEDVDGQPTQWVTAYPAGWTGPRVETPGTSAAGRTAYRYPAPGQFNVQGRVLDAAPEQLDDLDADRGTPWSVSSWSPAGAPGTPRFTGFYQERSWRQASVDWEDSLAEALSEVPRLAEAAGLAVRGLYGQLALRNGEERAARAFFAPDETPDDPAAELERLLEEPSGPEALDGLMRAFVYAAYAAPGLPTPVHEALTEGGGRFGGDSAYRAVHDSRGFRRVGGERGPALHLLRVFAALGLPSELLTPFRAAVAAWTIPYDLQSLHEVLRASHLIGMGAADERGAATRDGAALHIWTVDAFTESGLLPREDDGKAPAALVPPHRALYQDRMYFPFELTGTMDVPDALVTMADAALAGALPSRPTPRLQVMAAWLERYGDRGAAALSRLTPAHITALYLYSSYDYRLMKALLNGERLGRGVSRHLVRFHSWQYLLESAREEELDMPPLTLLSRPEFADLYAELTELPDLDTPHPDLVALRRRADAMADRLHDELRLHIDMAIEALEILPPVDRTIWWGERGAPGPIERPALNGPLYGDGAIEVASFRSTSLKIEEAVEFALSDKPVPARSHRRLIEVANSTARDAAPFLKHLSEGEALYPPGMRFDVVGRRLVESYRRPPMLHEVAEEETPLPDGLSEGSQTGPVPYTPAVFEDAVDDVFDLGRSDSDLSDADRYSETDSDADSGLVDAGPWKTDTRAYPRHDYWNAPWEGRATAPATQQIVVQEIDADGRTVGKASFTRRDWVLREPFYSRLPQATHYTEWSRGSAQERVAHRRPLPATGASGTFFWTSHGGPEGYAVAGANDLPTGADSAAVGRLLGQDLAAAGFTSITVLACDVATAAGGPSGTEPGGGSLERAVRRAADIADLTGLDVYLNTGRTAITPGRDEDGGPAADIHLLEAADGSPTTILRVLPRSRAGANAVLPAVPAPATDAPTQPWSVPGWRVAGAPETVRFARLYRDRNWRNLSFRFEAGLAQRLAAEPETVQAAAHALSRLRQALAQRHGPLAADGAFFQGSEAQQWTGQPDAVSRFLESRPSVPQLVQAFGLAAYGNKGPVTLQQTLPGWLTMPRPPWPNGNRRGAYRVAHDPRGFRYVGGMVGPALWMLQAYRALGASGPELLAFRKAVLSWSVLTETQSLHEVLRASHLAGVGLEAERAALAQDGARLHQVTARVFGMGPVLPHHQAYDLRTRFFSRFDTDIPGDLVQAMNAAMTGAPVSEELAERTEVAVQWLERFGDRARASLRALAPGHLTALYLYTGQDHELFKTYVTAGRFGEAVGRWMFGQRVWRYVREDAVDSGQGLPELLDHDEDLSGAMADLRDLGPDAAGPAVQEIRRRVDRVADRLYDDMSTHVDMAVEALEILPPLNGPVYWGGWLPGPLDAIPQDSPLLTATTLFVPRFRSMTESWERAGGYTRGDLKEMGDARDRHAMRGYVEHSTARPVAPFSAWLDEEEVLYPPGGALSIANREVVTEPESGRDYLDYEFREMPGYPHPAYHNAEDGTSPRIVELTDGTSETGESETRQPDAAKPRDGYRRTGPYAAELDGALFALHESPGEGDRTADVLLFAVRHAAAEGLRDAGVDTAEDFRAWLGGAVTDDDVSDLEVPPLDDGRDLPLALLDRVGASLGISLRTEAMLLGDRLPASRVALSPVQRLRVLLADPAYGPGGTALPMRPLVAATARRLGVTVAVAGPDDEVTFHGERTDGGPLALLVADGDRHLAGLPEGPGDTALDEEERLNRLVHALSFAPASVLRRAADRPAPEWVMARIRYMTEAVRFEQRLGRYLGGHEAVDAQLAVMTRELWDRAVAAGRWTELGSNDPTVDGAVGTGWDQLLAVVESGNTRERMGMLWIGSQAPDGQGGLISELLGSPDPNPDVITEEYRTARPQSRTITDYQQLSGRSDRTPEEQRRMERAGRELRTRARAEDLSPPLSEAERALMPDDGIPWIPGRHRYDIAMDSVPQAEAEDRGALVRAATSGSAHRLMSQAVKMRQEWGLDIDLGLVRLALMAEMLQAEHHGLDEIMRGSQLVLDRLRYAGAPEPADLDYVDNWGRYWRIAPLTEAELRQHVAVDGLFPDEHALRPFGDEELSGPADPADPAVAAWAQEHHIVLEDALRLLSALGPDTASGSAPLTPERLEHLVDAWFRTRNRVPPGSLADRIRRILNDVRA
ncbi:lonely Cys domain-containing protein [Streptomyces globisporus]|uniref:lonely Cys domain-containing protein n=1 Tax=Streptomyces globisporus TaxID=1908 RepID=UPI001F47CA13|nr:lonely Cys domain-containing protein [Streptomyces globisporus]